MWYVPTSFPHS
jgi:hypothetical protein